VPWAAFVIVPLFGFANAGVSPADIGLDAVLAPLPLGIPAELFLGRQLGIFGAVWLAVRFGMRGRCAARPGCKSTAWRPSAASASR
jgi:NhaA family Na+:H+ antiporter